MQCHLVLEQQNISSCIFGYAFLFLLQTIFHDFAFYPLKLGSCVRYALSLNFFDFYVRQSI